jgi:hypothetical protein
MGHNLCMHVHTHIIIVLYIILYVLYRKSWNTAPGGSIFQKKIV